MGKIAETPVVSGQESANTGNEGTSPLSSGQRKRGFMTPRRAAELVTEKKFRQLRNAKALVEERHTEKKPHVVELRCAKCPYWAQLRQSGQGRKVTAATRAAAVAHVRSVHPETFAAHCNAGGAE